MAPDTTFCPRPEWSRRFAYRVMLLRHEIDTPSAVMLGKSAFDAAGNLEPEDAAETFVEREHEGGP